MIRSSLCLLAVLGALGAAPSFASGPGNAGTYLAGQHAGFTSDFAKAADYYTRALSLDPRNPVLMERALTAQISLGHFDRAGPILTRIDGIGLSSPLANIVKLTQWVKAGDYQAVAKAYEGTFTVGGLLDGLIQPWIAVGEGRVSDAVAGFDALAEEPGLSNIAYYHKALALASAGDYDGAEAILSGEAHGPITVSARGLKAEIEILSQLDRAEDALTKLDQIFGTTPPPVFDSMAQRLRGGEILPFDLVTSAQDGLAEAFYSIAQALNGEAVDSLTLLYVRTASELKPDHVDALLLTASLLEAVEQYDLATGVYDLVPTDSPSFLNAEYGRANALWSSGRKDAATEVLRQLAKTYPDLGMIQEALADFLRRQERWADAETAYTRAVDLMGTPTGDDWGVFFSRGIARERQQKWDEAEADFRQALTLSPDQPQVLNYLGYSLVEQRVKLDEALEMIQKAVAARPEDGYIIDSLGWVYFRLGRYTDAVEPMERAVELMAIDPVVNDHLGDVYWAVGRKIEAEFQWRRALSFADYGGSSEEVDPDRIRRKLAVGLDQVLKDEGADPLVRPETGSQ